MPIIALIPLLAITTLLGDASDEVSASGPQLELQVEYPQRYRYNMVAGAEILVKNISSQDVPAVTVTIDNNYLDAFTDVGFTPEVDEVDDKAHKIELQDLRAGETRQVTLEMRAEKYGVHSGEVSAQAGSGEGTVRVELDTLIFP
jgi:hypothetical protein